MMGLGPVGNTRRLSWTCIRKHTQVNILFVRNVISKLSLSEKWVCSIVYAVAWTGDNSYVYVMSDKNRTYVYFN